MFSSRSEYIISLWTSKVSDQTLMQPTYVNEDKMGRIKRQIFVADDATNSNVLW